VGEAWVTKAARKLDEGHDSLTTVELVVVNVRGRANNEIPTTVLCWCTDDQDRPCSDCRDCGGTGEVIWPAQQA
jgi:hypothetical protein